MQSFQTLKNIETGREFPLTTNTFGVEYLQKWDMFREISSSLLMNVRLAYVYGEDSNTETGILVTKDDQMFTIQNNSSTKRGNNGPIRYIISRVEELCGKCVKTFVSGGDGDDIGQTTIFYLALTASGQVYSCGQNNLGQLGLGHFETGQVPLLIGGGLEGKVVNQVACGIAHCFAVTDDGHVYVWGGNGQGGRLGVGNDDVTNKSSPTRITLLPQGISRIACSSYYSVALSQQGDVYVWGYSKEMALGIGNVTHTNIPTKITTLSKIEKIVCGYKHTLALDKYGHLYVWGTNDREQLGPIGTIDVPRKECHPIPTKLSRGCIGGVQDIFSHHRSDWSFCKTNRGTVLFGNNEANLNRWHGSHYSHHDAMLLYTNVQFMLEPLVAEERRLSIGECMGNLFTSQDESTTDVTFIVQGQKIHAHQALLLCRNEYFQTMFSKKWKESGERYIELGGGDVKHNVYYALLYYIYSEMIIIPEEEHEHLLDLAIQADFCLEKRLSEKCLNILRQGINAENVCDFYILAKKKNSEELKGHVFDVIAENLQDLSSAGKIDELNLTAEEYLRLVKSITR